jgi:hypothetical protein
MFLETLIVPQPLSQYVLHYRVHSSPSLRSIANQMNTVHNHTFGFLIFISILSSLLHLGLSRGITLMFLFEIVNALLRATRHAHPIFPI